MKNKLLILLIAISFTLTGCGGENKPPRFTYYTPRSANNPGGGSGSYNTKDFLNEARENFFKNWEKWSRDSSGQRDKQTTSDPQDQNKQDLKLSSFDSFVTSNLQLIENLGEKLYYGFYKQIDGKPVDLMVIATTNPKYHFSQTFITNYVDDKTASNYTFFGINKSLINVYTKITEYLYYSSYKKTEQIFESKKNLSGNTEYIYANKNIITLIQDKKIITSYDGLSHFYQTESTDIDEIYGVGGINGEIFASIKYKDQRESQLYTVVYENNGREIYLKFDEQPIADIKNPRKIYSDGKTICVASLDGIYVNQGTEKTWVHHTNKEMGFKDDAAPTTIHCNENAIYVAFSKGMSISTDGGKIWVIPKFLNDKKIEDIHEQNGLIFVATKDKIYHAKHDNIEEWTVTFSAPMSLGKYTIIFFHQVDQNDLSDFQILANEINEKDPQDWKGILGMNENENENSCSAVKSAYTKRIATQKMHPDKHMYDGFFHLANTVSTKINDAYTELNKTCT